MRVSPSGTFDVLSESFNKTQLVFTVLGYWVRLCTHALNRQRRCWDDQFCTRLSALYDIS